MVHMNISTGIRRLSWFKSACLLDSKKLPIVGVDSARKLMNRNLPSNTLINRASDRTPV